ncbi:MAG: hypothetical protein HGA87_02510 [Desulfobulbaceae bacterium]|nr:hypothetical protein [Desulfobulbaceae bacterium]
MNISDLSPKVIIDADVQAQANTDLPDVFTLGYSADGQEPATHYIANGWWEPDDINKIMAGDFDWPCTVRFGAMADVLEALGLQPIIVNELLP